MGKIVITAATGQLGGLVVKHLLELGIPAQNIAAAVRNEEKAAGLKKLGLEIRRGDYDQPATLREAFRDADKLLFISGSSNDGSLRIRQHASVAEAARDAKVGQIVYTSLAFADEVMLGMENVHLATEWAIKETHLPYTILRNPFYIDLVLNPLVRGAVATGVIASASKGGKMNFVTRSDLALAAAKVLATDGHQNKVYELANPQPYTFDQFAAILSEVSGKEIKHRDGTPEQAREQLIKQGLPAETTGFYTFIWRCVELGYFGLASADLSHLIGSKFTSVKEDVQNVLRGL